MAAWAWALTQDQQHMALRMFCDVAAVVRESDLWPALLRAWSALPIDAVEMTSVLAEGMPPGKLERSHILYRLKNHVF
jgi:hypothetical protein